MRNDYPAHWLPGQLLDLKRYTNGSYRATLLGEEADPKKSNWIDFESGHDAQAFTSWWYLPAEARERYGQAA